MKSSPSARSWIAAGVRHELLMRSLPALRHEMAGPVSLLRMTLLMLKRHAGANPVDGAACLQRVDQASDQLALLVDSVRALRDWELATSDEGLARGELVRQCAGLMRAAFDLNGLSLEVDERLDVADESEPRWPDGAALRYLLLGALGHLHDQSDQPVLVRIVPGDEAHLVRVCVMPKPEHREEAELMPHRAPRSLAIDAVCLQSLADDLGRTITIGRDEVVLSLKAG
ncbi:hypothetical protein [Pseudacidovorax sp. RU35E]|jgi:hypothetical protein|uniref:hypothetical protein n=1 Tax=Pseudacidovorax sp. RU35E TaxID=1907403 RepID=UPI0009553195|nr:hypothetical protein [Pseudacidovorax sp. RU35E]SIR49042.1 hypothetical protein SAMN05880557_1128 [Pseudacidovorax sp. RU35E]